MSAKQAGYADKDIGVGGRGEKRILSALLEQ